MTRHVTNRIIAKFRIENELYNNKQEMRRRKTK